MTATDIQYFGESGTWAKPARAVRVDYLICGAGAGGSAGLGETGRDGEPGTLRCGSLDAGTLPDKLEVIIGRGGRGAVLGPFKGGDGADGYALFVTHLASPPLPSVPPHDLVLHAHSHDHPDDGEPHEHLHTGPGHMGLEHIHRHRHATGEQR